MLFNIHQNGHSADTPRPETPPWRYALIDRGRLMELLGFDDSNRLTEAYKGWVEEVLEGDGYTRDAKWSAL